MSLHLTNERAGLSGCDIQARFLSGSNDMRPATHDAISAWKPARSELGVSLAWPASTATSTCPLSAVGVAGGNARLVRVVLLARPQDEEPSQFQLDDRNA